MNSLKKHVGLIMALVMVSPLAAQQKHTDIKEISAEELHAEIQKNLKKDPKSGLITVANTKKMARLKSTKLVVINVLSRDYHKKHHIAHSINIPLSEILTLNEALKKGKAPGDLSTKRKILYKLLQSIKDKHVVVYCARHECTASRTAYKKLSNDRFGFSNIEAYEGGVQEWASRGYKIRGEQAKKFMKKHGPKKLKSQVDDVLNNGLEQDDDMS